MDTEQRKVEPRGGLENGRREDDDKHPEDTKGIRKGKMKKGMFFINESLGVIFMIIWHRAH